MNGTLTGEVEQRIIGGQAMLMGLPMFKNSKQVNEHCSYLYYDGQSLLPQGLCFLRNLGVKILFNKCCHFKFLCLFIRQANTCIEFLNLPKAATSLPNWSRSFTKTVPSSIRNVEGSSWPCTQTDTVPFKRMKKLQKKRQQIFINREQAWKLIKVTNSL